MSLFSSFHFAQLILPYRLALRRLHDLRQSRNVPAQQIFQRGAVRVAGFAPAKAHAVGAIGEGVLMKSDQIKLERHPYQLIDG